MVEIFSTRNSAIDLVKYVALIDRQFVLSFMVSDEYILCINLVLSIVALCEI